MWLTSIDAQVINTVKIIQKKIEVDTQSQLIGTTATTTKSANSMMMTTTGKAPTIMYHETLAIQSSHWRFTIANLLLFTTCLYSYIIIHVYRTYINRFRENLINFPIAINLTTYTLRISVLYMLGKIPLYTISLRHANKCFDASDT